MQVFVPYQSPIEVAKCLDERRLRMQIIECNQILEAICGKSNAWRNHPVVKMYSVAYSWLHDYKKVLEYYLDGNIDMVDWWSMWADASRPLFLTEEFCDQHKRRLYTKSPILYPQFASYGTSEENWYFVDGKIVKYVNGKRI